MTKIQKYFFINLAYFLFAFCYIKTLCQRFKEAPQKLFNAVGRLKLKGDELRTQGDEHWFVN